MLKKLIIVLGLLVAFGGIAMAGITQEEANQLGGDKLTAIGAEKAGNADGSIPPYTGGYTKVPPNFDVSKQILPDPFASDKPLFSIDSKNMGQYAEKLTAGTKELITKNPTTFRVDVYPTHRSVGIPDYIAEGTKKSAMAAQLESDGRKLSGTHCGIPFPIPKNGLEAVWNCIVRWAAPAEEYLHYQSFVITAAGRRIMTSEGHSFSEYPYWNPKATKNKDKTWMVSELTYAPANRSGEGMMWILSTDKSHGADPAWQYLPGQRRVKMAPEIAYDGPNTTVSGASTYDDAFVYTGSPDRYDWKIVGKKEMIVPYNSYKLLYHPADNPQLDQVFGPQHLNPDFVRWELHRVWVVEGNLKADARHIYKRRVLYLDEDSWCALMADEYDMKDQFYRSVFSTFAYNYVTQAPVTIQYYGYDFISGIYWYNVYFIGPNLVLTFRPDSEWSPQGLAGALTR